MVPQLTSRTHVHPCYNNNKRWNVSFDMKMSCFQSIVKQTDSECFSLLCGQDCISGIEISYWEIIRSFIKEHRVPLQPRPFVCSEFSYQRCQNVDFWHLLNCLVWFQKCSIFVMSRIILKLPRGMISWWWQPFSATFQTHAHHSQG